MLKIRNMGNTQIWFWIFLFLLVGIVIYTIVYAVNEHKKNKIKHNGYSRKAASYVP